MQRTYSRVLERVLHHPWMVVVVMLAAVGISVLLLRTLPVAEPDRLALGILACVPRNSARLEILAG